jgi:hypothetical protein
MFGRCSNRTCPDSAVNGEELHRITGDSSTQFSGFSGQAHHGAIYLLTMEIGTVSPSGSDVGSSKVFGNQYSNVSLMIPISSG